jgi:integrase
MQCSVCARGWKTRVVSNPMRAVGKVNGSSDPQRRRRAFTVGELRELVEVAGERGIAYMVAACTGIRRGELVKIEWRNVHIDGPRPYIAVRASIAKNDKVAHQPVPLIVAAELRQRRPADVTPTDLVFKRLIPRMNRFRDDLWAAGIPYVDRNGEYADFHSLRKTLGTELAKAGVPMRAAMQLMPHSHPNLTAKTYTDAGKLPVWDAVAGLALYNDTQIDTLKLVASGQNVSTAVPIKDHGRVLLAAGEQTFSLSESASVGESPEVADGARCRVRTCDFLRVKQALYH